MSLGRLLAEHGEAIEADLLRFYHLDIADVGTERLSWRRLRVLLRHLPRESAFVRDRAGEAARGGETEQLLALLADTLAAINRNLVQPHSRTLLPKAQRLPRPGVTDRGDGRRWGSSAMPLDVMRKRLERLNGPRKR